MAVRRGERRAARAPPPTPIATGRGLRSAAVDDRVLAEYLESSLRVPELTLPESFFPARSSPLRVPGEIELAPLLAREESTTRRVLEEAVRVGAVRLRGDDVVTAEEVRLVVEEAEKRVLGGGVEIREGAAKEMCWYRPVRSETEAALQEMWQDDTYRSFREKMESIACKLERVAECIAQILSESIRIQRRSRSIGKRESVLCLRKYSIHRYGENQSDDAQQHQSHALTLCISGVDHEFYIRSPEGSASFFMPAGSILVTIGKQLQEWSDSEFKCAFAEPFIEEDHDSPPPFFLDFMCSPLALDRDLDDMKKTVSIMDQLLIVVALVILYGLWAFISSKLTKT